VVLHLRSVSTCYTLRGRTHTSKRASLAPILLISNPPEVTESHNGHFLRVVFVVVVVTGDTVLPERKDGCGKNSRRTLIDPCKQGVEGTFEVYVLDTLDIDRSLIFDDPDALLQCQKRVKVRIQELIDLQHVFANSHDSTTTRVPPMLHVEEPSCLDMEGW